MIAEIHLPELVTFSENHQSNLILDYKNADYSRLSEEIAKIDFVTDFQSKDPNEMTAFFYQNIFSCLDKCVPKKTVRTSFKHPPWYGKKLNNLKNRKNKVFSHAKQSRLRKIHITSNSIHDIALRKKNQRSTSKYMHTINQVYI